MNEPAIDIETKVFPKAPRKAPEPDIRPRNRLGDLISEKREMRRSIGWPSGRQWRKYRKNLRQATKETQVLFDEAGIA